MKKYEVWMVLKLTTTCWEFANFSSP